MARTKVIAGKSRTGVRRIFVRIQGAPAGAQPGYGTAGATKKTGKKTSILVCDFPEIALASKR
jgi:hypothetical protein